MDVYGDVLGRELSNVQLFSLLCIDRQRASAEDSLKHPWLDGPSNSLAHLRTSLLSGSEPESPSPSPELVIVASYSTCSGQSEKAARGPFPFDEPFPTRAEIKQELIC